MEASPRVPAAASGMSVRGGVLQEMNLLSASEGEWRNRQETRMEAGEISLG
jgi:hypothetical protein